MKNLRFSVDSAQCINISKLVEHHRSDEDHKQPVISTGDSSLKKKAMVVKVKIGGVSEFAVLGLWWENNSQLVTIIRAVG